MNSKTGLHDVGDKLTDGLKKAKIGTGRDVLRIIERANKPDVLEDPIRLSQDMSALLGMANRVGVLDGN